MKFDDYKGNAVGSPEVRPHLQGSTGTRTRSGHTKPELERVAECARRNVKRGKRRR